MLIFSGYFCLMDDLYEVSDRDICQPEWLSDFVQDNFPDLFLRYDDEFDYTDYIYPIESDGVTNYLFKSQIGEILQIQHSSELLELLEYLRSIDLLQREYLPSHHLEDVRFLVSFSLDFYIRI